MNNISSGSTAVIITKDTIPPSIPIIIPGQITSGAIITLV